MPKMFSPFYNFGRRVDRVLRGWVESHEKSAAAYPPASCNKRQQLHRVAAGACLLGCLVLGIAALSCGPYKPEVPEGAHPYSLTVPTYFPNKLHIPANNPLTVEGIDLGRYLFYDGRISGYAKAESWRSCASCHKQANAFEDGSDYNAPTPHAMLPLFNVAFHFGKFHWSGDTDSLERVIYMALTDPKEIGGKPDSIVKKIAAIPFYRDKFTAAFGGATHDSLVVTMDRICKAVAQFVRTIVSADSKFDRYLRGEATLSDEELKGYLLFTTEEGADCFHCHGGSGNVLFSTYGLANNGLDPDSLRKDPYDYASVSKKATDKGTYRVPSLRNLAYTAPYMHDGRFKTIDEVIDQYSEGVHYSPNISPLMHHVSAGGVQLTPSEKQALKAFLLTLSDESLLTNPNLAKPNDSRLP